MYLQYFSRVLPHATQLSCLSFSSLFPFPVNLLVPLHQRIFPVPAPPPAFPFFFISSVPDCLPDCVFRSFPFFPRVLTFSCHHLWCFSFTFPFVDSFWPQVVTEFSPICFLSQDVFEFFTCSPGFCRSFRFGFVSLRGDYLPPHFPVEPWDRPFRRSLSSVSLFRVFGPFVG